MYAVRLFVVMCISYMDSTPTYSLIARPHISIKDIVLVYVNTDVESKWAYGFLCKTEWAADRDQG